MSAKQVQCHGPAFSRRNVLSAVSAFALSPPIFSAEAGTQEKFDLSFSAAFPRHLIEKPSFAIALTGAAIVAAGAFTYVTAGAGAPAAATGVSTVASWVAGGGAGSYMAGLSTIGGWFGGNAMVGAAILNGISLGTVGGMTSFGALSASQKAIVVTSIAATTLDGIALVRNPETQELAWGVLLTVPVGLAEGAVKELSKRLADANEKVASLLKELSKAKPEASKRMTGSSKTEPTGKMLEIEANLAAEGARHGKIVEQLMTKIDAALTENTATTNDLVLAVLAHNFGKPEKFRRLLAKFSRSTIENKKSSYFDYLQGVASLQTGKERQAIELLEAAWRDAPYAIESPILIINILGSRGRFAGNEQKILEIAAKASKKFDADDYAPRLTPVSMYYRIGSQALQAKRCKTSLDAFAEAAEALSFFQKHRGSGKDIRNLIAIGKANALYCGGEQTRAFELFGAVRKHAEDDEKELLCAHFTGGCRK
jgi:hypothetical protein